MASGVHRKLRAQLGSRSSRRKGTKYQSHNQVRVKGANRRRTKQRTPWARIKGML